jgi:hypothetical protein
MENKEQDRALQAPAEANRDKHINYLADEDTDAGIDAGNEESIESRRRKHDADSGNDGSSNEILQMELRIDPGNEHHHRTDADDKIFDEDIDRSPRYDADAGGDGTGTVGPEPDEK